MPPELDLKPFGAQLQNLSKICLQSSIWSLSGHSLKTYEKYAYTARFELFWAGCGWLTVAGWLWLAGCDWLASCDICVRVVIEGIRLPYGCDRHKILHFDTRSKIAKPLT